MNLLQTISEIPICFGGAAISGEGGGYGFGEISDTSANALLMQAFDLGITIFDTAPIYGFGLSEKRLGMAFRRKREKVFIISKSGVTWHNNRRVNMTNDPVTTIKMLEQSLRDLQSDYIDLYMIHWPDNKIDIRRPMEALASAKSQGKIKHLGLCNTNLVDLDLAAQIDSIEVVQSEFNLFHRQSEDFLNYLSSHHIAFMSWGTFDKGIISGTVTNDRTYDRSDARGWAPWWDKKANRKKIATIEKIATLLNAHGHTLLELACGYNLTHPPLTHLLCGMRTPWQLNETIRAVKNPPPRSLIAQ